MKLKPEVDAKVRELEDQFPSFKGYTVMEYPLSLDAVFDAIESIAWNYLLMKHDDKYTVTVVTSYDVLGYEKVREYGQTRMEAAVNALYSLVKGIYI